MNKIKKAFRIFSIILRWGLLVGFFLAIIIAVIVIIKGKPLLEEYQEMANDKLATISDQTFCKLSNTKIYDNNEELLSEINISNYEYVKIDDVSDYVYQGYIAVEDRSFMMHHGIDYSAIVRAGLDMLKHGGKITQGGSTITQQVIKNNLLTQEKTIDRKILEFYIAPQIEDMYSKDQIMEFYVNTNFYGNNCYGISAAAKYYFGVTPKELDIAQSAFFIGVSNNGTLYNIKNNYDGTINKQKKVLKIMLDEGVITSKEYNAAISEELNFVYEKKDRAKESYTTSYAIHCATLALMEKEGFQFQYIFEDAQSKDDYDKTYKELYSEISQNIRKGGYSIYTSFDKTKQEILQREIDAATAAYTEKTDEGKYAFQAAAVIINNETGYVEAIVGGRGVNDEYNRAYQSKRQPGSSIKPLVVYTPAFCTGRYYPSLLMEDKPNDADPYYPTNYENKYRGKIHIREAVARSINTIAYQILEDISPKEGLSYLAAMKFDSIDPEDVNSTSVALGGFTYGVRICDMAKGYSTIAREGEYLDNDCIVRINYQGEGTIYQVEGAVTQVYSRDAAYMMIDVLKDVLVKPYGTGRTRELGNAIAFAKTGTTNETKDAWFCGASTYYSMAVWVGYDQPKSTNITGSGLPGQIWKNVMTQLHSNVAVVDWERPDSVVERNINYKGEVVGYRSGRTDLFSSSILLN